MSGLILYIHHGFWLQETIEINDHRRYKKHQQLHKHPGHWVTINPDSYDKYLIHIYVYIYTYIYTYIYIYIYRDSYTSSTIFIFYPVDYVYMDFCQDTPTSTLWEWDASMGMGPLNVPYNAWQIHGPKKFKKSCLVTPKQHP